MDEVWRIRFSRSTRRDADSLRGDAERSVNDLNEVSFFAQNQARGLRHREVLATPGVRFQARPVGLVRREAVERDEPSG